MKKLLIIIVGIIVVLYVMFVVTRHPAIAPNGESPSPTPTATVQGNVTVSSPKSGDHVAHTFTVTGTERTFEQGVVMRLYDSTGVKILEDHTTGSAADMGIYGPYSFTVTVPATITGNIELWVFDYSARDGSIIELNKIPLVLK